MTTTASTATTGLSGFGEPTWLTLHEAARVLGVHANTLRRWSDRAAIRSYRTVGGHRRLDARDVYELAGASGTTPAPTKVVEPRCLDDEALATIELSLRGGLSDSECRLRLRSYGRAAGTAARLAGQRPAATIRSFLPVRREIGELVAHVRFSAGIGRSEVDERQWSDSLADAFFLGLADSADVIRARVRGGERRRGETTVMSRRGPPQ